MKISIIDDHTIIGESLKVFISICYPESSVYCYNSPAEFLENPASTSMDIIILDLLMPSESGLDFILNFRHKFQSSKFIVVSSLADAHTIRYAVRLGVDAYVSKVESLVEITQAISSVMENKQYLSNKIRTSLIDYMWTEEKVIFHLTPREKQVLQKVCNGQTIKEIAYNLKISVHTAQEHYKNIMKKFKVNRTSDLIVFAIKHGIYYV